MMEELKNINTQVRTENAGADVDLMTGAEVADFLRVHIASVRRWARSGRLHGYRLGGRGDWRFRRQDVLSFLRGLDGSGDLTQAA